MSKMGIRKSLTIVITAIAIIAVMLVSVIDGIIEVWTYHRQQMQTIAARLESSKNLMESWLNEKSTVLEFMTMEAAYKRFTYDSEECLAFLQNCEALDPDIYACYMGFADGTSVFSDEWDPIANNYDPLTRGWYINAAAADGCIITEPYTDAQSGRMVITVAEKIVSDGSVYGVIALDVFLDTMAEFVNDLRIDENGYALLILSDSSIIVHENSAYLPTLDADENDVFTKLTDVTQGYSAVTDPASLIKIKDYNGDTAEYSETVMESTGWKLGYMLDRAEYNKITADTIKLFVILTVVIGVIVALISFLALKKAFSPLAMIAEKSREVASGVLDVTFNYDANDEVGEVCRTIEHNNAFVKNYINDISYRLEGIAHGDFSRRSQPEYIGDYISIKTSLDMISDDLTEVFNGIETASADVSVGANEVSNGSTSLAETVSKQTELIQNIVSGIGSVSEKIDSNVSGTDDAREAAQQTASVVNIGSAKMDALIKAMDEISESTEEIKKIINTIEDISFQTNILSLNASIEAARAGASGKGFAVVADEVRNLASKSSKASEQTSELIERSVNAVQNGRTIADDTFKSLSKVVEQTEKIDKIIVSINEDSHKQRGLMSEINEKVTLVSNYVTSAAANAQESAASAEELNGQAASLRDIIRSYRK